MSSGPSLDFLRSDEADPPVTVIREIRVRPGNQSAFEDLMARLIAEAVRAPGHLGATVVRPDPLRLGDAHRFVYKFDRRSHLEAWHASKERARLFAPIEPLIESDRYDEFTGLETWFELPGASIPPRWKTTLMTWATIYVLVVIVSYAMRAVRFEAPLPIRALVLTGIVVPWVAYVIAPRLGRLLHGWLHAGAGHPRAKRVRSALVLLAIGVLAAEARAAAPHPSYQKLRYDEDYSSLRDPTQRTDFWDPLKYLSLNDSGDTYLSLGGEARWRYERYHHYQWNPDSPDEDGYLLQRYLVHADLHVTPAFRLFGQLQSSLEDWRAGGPRPSDEDRLDLHQLFADARLPIGAGSNAITLRVGRQEMLYGTQRLVSVRESPNIRRAFDAARVLSRVGSWSVDAFFSRPVDEDVGEFDDWESINGNDFYGAYASHAGPGEPGVDLYYLGLRTPDAEFAQGTGTAERHSIGGRLFGESSGWDYNIEGVVQFGHFARSDILAWTLASDTGYTFDGAPLSPRFGVKADVISGDADPDDHQLGTFDPLFPRGAYFEEISLVWPANLINVDPEVALQILPGLDLRANWNVFWRYSTHDGLYTNGFRLARFTDGGSRFIGHQASAALEWRPERHVTIDVSYGHFFAGHFIRSSGPDTDVDFVATWLIYRF